ncbi:ABC transporter ATP-binding protein [Streptococcus massiliensis]|uniref:ABC transporter ATP-binding protein n=1 Tax=Streptococcus massiliensis TaxID=313439 RepID=A0A380KZ65_9STRE|nr:ABC transporter ATP-binding protein [Streptococcus massiliensis]SUN76226.1 ABC transporter ATP-binding protein [Streptococcus massiliensis]
MIYVKDIKKTYGQGEAANPVLRGLTFEVEAGEFLVVLGASGSGKTTLLSIMSGLEKADSGQIIYDTTDISSYSEEELTRFRKEHTAFVFQQYYLLPNLTVEKNVQLAADLIGKKDVSALLDTVGLLDKKDKFPSQLSGGEQQRVALARALAKKPQVLFLDEPTGALDEARGRQVLEYLTQVQKEKAFTMIMITHNPHIAELADRVITIRNGQIEKIQRNTAKKSVQEIGW